MSNNIKILPELIEDNMVIPFRSLATQEVFEVLPTSEPKFKLLSKNEKSSKEDEWLVEISCEDNNLLNEKGFVYSEDFLNE
jgi:hypothetical protein